MKHSVSELGKLFGTDPLNLNLVDDYLIKEFSVAAINQFCFSIGVSVLPTKSLADTLASLLSVKYAEFGSGSAVFFDYLAKQGKQGFLVDNVYDKLVDSTSSGITRVEGFYPIQYRSGTVQQQDIVFLKDNIDNFSDALVLGCLTNYDFPYCTIDVKQIVQYIKGLLYITVEEGGESYAQIMSNFSVNQIPVSVFGRGSGKLVLLQVGKKFGELSGVHDLPPLSISK